MPCYDPRDNMTREEIEAAEERSRRAREAERQEELIRLQREQNEILRKEREAHEAHDKTKHSKEHSIDYNTPLNKMTRSFCKLSRAIVETGHTEIITELMDKDEEFAREFLLHQAHDMERGETYINPRTMQIVHTQSLPKPSSLYDNPLSSLRLH